MKKYPAEIKKDKEGHYIVIPQEIEKKMRQDKEGVFIFRDKKGLEIEVPWEIP